MLIARTIEECVSFRKKLNNSVGLVPTMGSLHSGHIALIKSSLKKCDITIVSIFLNPKQFSANEDLDSYPADDTRDIKILKQLNIDCLFMPRQSQIYLEDNSIDVVENKLSKLLEGNSRPHFFKGVLTIVSKLFNICSPTDVFFGKKDAQQLILVKKLIKDLNYNIKCHEIPIVRSEKGLALSSRNEYFNEFQKEIASNIYKSLCLVKTSIDKGEYDVVALKTIFRISIQRIPELKIDYFSIADIRTLEEVVDTISSTVLISTAILLDGVRLIDNIEYVI
tara:strand:+ start:1321 stop:2160 length:840 start_codon:yes stop_codon:yes gene_type:complete